MSRGTCGGSSVTLVGAASWLVPSRSYATAPASMSSTVQESCVWAG
nr:hypothetical protein [Polymorphospora rubra]